MEGIILTDSDGVELSADSYETFSLIGLRSEFGDFVVIELPSAGLRGLGRWALEAADEIDKKGGDDA